MKNPKSFLAALILLSSMTASAAVFAADGVIEKDPFTARSYCHEKFQAMEGQSLDSHKQVLKNPNSEDVIDFYGSCNESPVGQDQVQQQKLERQHRFANGYEG